MKIENVRQWYKQKLKMLVEWKLKMCDIELQLPMQSVPITTDVVSLNVDQSEVYNIMW
jgi:hypothetical protein